MDVLSLLPHQERLLCRIAALETPLVQVWGWPGSGKSALLATFCERQGAGARGLSQGELSDREALREIVAGAPEVRWFVVSGGVRESLAEVARWLRPGQRLVFASERRWEREGLPLSIVAPQELLLTPSEIGTLWLLLAGEAPAQEAAESLWTATDGWHQPIRLALEATGGTGLENADAEDLLEISAIRSFLRHEVLDPLGEEGRCLLEDLPAERPAKTGVQGWCVLDAHGLWVEGEERDRLPTLLGAFLERERFRRRETPARSKALSSARLEGVPRYKLGFLGSPVANRRDPDGTEIDLDCRLRRSLQVLAYLASSPGMEAGREELMEAIWPTEGERTIDRNFHPTLSHLRRALEAGFRQREQTVPLLFRRGVYRLNPDFVWEVDALELDLRLDEGKARLERGEPAAAAEAWERGWRLYRGAFLQGHYEAWVSERRDRYQRHYLELLRELGDVYLRLELPEKAMDAYRSVLLEDPLYERVHVALMRLYASQGRRDLVRRQYDRLCTLLLEEVGVQPQPQTTRDYHRLME